MHNSPLKMPARENDVAEMTDSSHLKFRAWAEPNANGEGYVSFWGAPGLRTGMVRTPDGKPAIFATREEAELEAWRVMAQTLNRPRIRADSGKPERYKRLTGAELAEKIRAAGITPSFFAYLRATTQKRVLDWIDNKQDIPHDVRVLLELFIADERNIDIAEEVTDRVTTERNPKRSEE